MEKNAEALCKYCEQKGYGQGVTHKWAVKHFEVLVKNLTDDEEIELAFIGLRNYVSASKHEGNFVFAITNKRFISAQKKLVGEIVQSINWNNVNDITMNKKLLGGIITIDTYKEKTNVCLNKDIAQNVFDELYPLFEKAKQHSKEPIIASSNLDAYEEIKKVKELLDMGIINQEEFDKKKKELLNL